MFEYAVVTPLTPSFLPPPARGVFSAVYLFKGSGHMSVFFLILFCWLLSFTMNEYAVLTFTADTIQEVDARFVSLGEKVPLGKGRYFGESFSNIIVCSFNKTP